MGCGADRERPSLPCSRGSWLASEWLGVVLKDVLSVVKSWTSLLGADMAGDAGPESVLVPWEREQEDELGDCGGGGMATDIWVAVDERHNQSFVLVGGSNGRMVGGCRLRREARYARTVVCSAWHQDDIC